MCDRDERVILYLLKEFDSDSDLSVDFADLAQIHKHERIKDEKGVIEKRLVSGKIPESRFSH